MKTTIEGKLQNLTIKSRKSVVKWNYLSDIKEDWIFYDIRRRYRYHLFRLSFCKTQMKMMKIAGTSSAAGFDLHLCCRSHQELSSCIQSERSAVRWHFITSTWITVDLLFSLIVWPSCDIFNASIRDVVFSGSATCFFARKKIPVLVS